MKLLQIVYLSEAVSDFGELDLVKLVNHAFTKNRDHNITGVMYYRDGRFIQCLEGADRDVIGLYAKILEDPRHTKIVTAVVKPIDKRMFPDWSMGLVNGLPDELDVDNLSEVELGTVGAWNQARWADILRSFRAANIAA